MFATCVTSGCPSEGIPIEVTRPQNPETGQDVPDDEWSVVCGVCNQPITELTEEGPPS